MSNSFMSHEDREELNYEMFWRTISRCRTIGELMLTEIRPRYAGTRNWFDRYEVASGEYILVCQDCGTIQFSDHEETDPCLVCGFGSEDEGLPQRIERQSRLLTNLVDRIHQLARS